ncbi:MAG: phosphonate ABC transporter ATP-binding protein [Anaerolineae bacterium]|nr:phosphonate ABC transporter ATP-binding protein [Anaerolineae bacterium]
MSFLEINNLRVVYPNGHEALKSVSLQAEAGEIVALVGSSGAGKSTLLRCVNGLQQPVSGTIILDGEAITAMDEQQLQKYRCCIGFIWQEYNLVDRLPVLTNVLTGRLGRMQGFPSLIGYFSPAQREIAVRNLERVNLLERALQRADSLSGGEKQRVSIARAVSQDPKIILADEPVASLDPELSWHVMSDLSRVAREDGVLTLICIHQIDLAREFADRVIGIARGVVTFDGSPSELDEAALDRIYKLNRSTVTPAAAPAGDESRRSSSKAPRKS